MLYSYHGKSLIPKNLTLTQKHFLFLSRKERQSCCLFKVYTLFEPQHDKTNKITCAHSEKSNQPGHLPSLIRVFAVRFRVARDPVLLQADSED